MKLIKFIFSILSESALKSIGAVIGLLTLAFVSIFVVTGSTDGFFCSKAFSDKIGLDVCGDETKISKGKGEEKELDSGTSWDGWSTSEVNVALRRRLEHAIKLRDTQRPKQAEIDFTRIQADVAEYFGIDSIEMAEVLNHFGSVYSQLDMPEKRIELFEETVRIYVKHQGPNSIRAAENRVNMTGALRRLGRTEEAQRQLEAALLVFENSGYKGQGYGTAIESLANLEFEKGSLKTAKKLYEEAISVFETAVGKKHDNFIDSTFGFGFLLQQSGECAEAKKWFEEGQSALNLSGKFLTDHRRRAVDTLNSLPC